VSDTSRIFNHKAESKLAAALLCLSAFMGAGLYKLEVDNRELAKFESTSKIEEVMEHNREGIISGLFITGALLTLAGGAGYQALKKSPPRPSPT
jgi:hypothetical protein